MIQDEANVFYGKKIQKAETCEEVVVMVVIDWKRA